MAEVDGLKERRDDKEFVLEELKKNPSMLEFASERLKDDEEVVRVAILGDGGALEFASDR